MSGTNSVDRSLSEIRTSIDKIEKNLKKSDVIIQGIHQSLKRILDLFEDILSISKPENFDDLIVYNRRVNEKILSGFEDDLKGKTDDYKRALSDTILRVYDLSKKGHNQQDFEKLRELLLEKNDFRIEIYAELLEAGKFDMVLSENEVNDALCIIRSGFLQNFDDLFYRWHNNQAKIGTGSVEDEQGNIYDDSYIDQPLYAGVQDRKIVPYSALMDTNIDASLLSQISDPDIRDYFMSVIKLLDNTSYQDWLSTELPQHNNWTQSTGTLGLIGTMESYFKPYLVEPELLLCIKNTQNIDKDTIVSYAQQEFGETYDMQSVQYHEMEPLLRGGRSAFGGFLGKTFPNDQDLSDELGTIIMINTGSIQTNLAASAKKDMETLLGYEYDFSLVTEYFLEKVRYHEFGHSLFKKMNTSDFEESKATLYYFLKLRNDYESGDIDENEIDNILFFILADTIRSLKNRGESTYQYRLESQFFLKTLFETGCIEWNEDRLSIAGGPDNFKLLLEEAVLMLHNIKNIYEHKDITQSNQRELVKEIQNGGYRNEKELLSRIDITI